MKKIILLNIAIYSCSQLIAQTMRTRIILSRNDKPIVFRADGASVDITGYDGNEVVIEAVPEAAKADPPEAAGLKSIAMPGRENEDLVIHPKIQDNDNILSIDIPPGNFKHLIVKVPQSVSMEVVSMYYLPGVELSITNINDVYVGAIVPLISLNKVGSFIISSGGAHAGLHAADKILLSNIQWSNKPFMVNGKPHNRSYSAAGNSATIILSVPDTLKASINFNSYNGQVFSNLNTTSLAATDADLKNYAKDFHLEPKLKTINLNNSNKTININLETNYGNIYLKKQ